MSRALIFACGNPSRGDDALGPRLIERLAAPKTPIGGMELELLTDFQLQIEHALDLAGRDRVVFVDAAVAGPEPFDFSPVRAESQAAFTTHAMTPGALLRVYAQLALGDPPECRVLAIRGYRFRLGDGLSEKAAANLEAALDRLVAWLLEGAGETERSRGLGD